ncbi:YlmC/YmxH family sporulation protein [Salsuginibacillus halophilus]|uniref:YlmC/YmxH family sporulation protein n=2 Tax=Salsuginibacillus halophilus TaxID=517424 RepID=A0A2P8HX23_9BACI|nr:YlmC/YmxH family sporulation protein [Salsuginibacillus halophilus]
MRISDLQTKDIVSMVSGRRLGHVSDVDINVATGFVESLVVGGAPKMLGWLQKEGEWVIPWSDIVKIGNDVILVQVPDEAGFTSG